MGGPAEMEVFTRHEEGRVHCEWFAYFSLAAVDVTKAVEANSCAKQAHEGLNLLVGRDECWPIQFGGA